MMCNRPSEDLLVCITYTLLLKYKKKITLSIISEGKGLEKALIPLLSLSAL